MVMKIEHFFHLRELPPSGVPLRRKVPRTFRGGRSRPCIPFQRQVAALPPAARAAWPRVERALDAWLEASPEAIRQTFLHALPAQVQREVPEIPNFIAAPSACAPRY